MENFPEKLRRTFCSKKDFLTFVTGNNLAGREYAIAETVNATTTVSVGPPSVQASLRPFLIFNLSGNVPDDNDKLISDNNGSEITSMDFLITEIGILSAPAPCHL